jgi:branched-chain amino acid transport system substrate-binding protein
MRRIVFLIIATLLVIGLALPGCARSTLTILSITEGDVFVMKAGTDDWIEAEAGMSLKVGDTIKTSDNSSAEITFFEGSTIELKAGAEIEIASLEISAETDSVTIILEQTIGSIIFRVKKVIDPASRYEVETPTGVVAVRGSAVAVHVIEDGTTWATNLEGNIYAIAQGVELQVPEGRQSITRPGQPPELVITFAVAGPMTDFQGQMQWEGAQMAADEINAAGGITINSTAYPIELVQVETKEMTEGEDGSTGTANLQAVIDDVAFVAGGFRTQTVQIYREVAMNAEKIFMDCGAATGSLQFSVVTDYDKYKYWFKSTPYNETFLFSSCMKMTTTIGNILKETLATLEASNSTQVKEEFELSSAQGGKLRVHILMENAVWCAPIVLAAQYYLPLLGFTVTGTTLVSPTAADITTEMNAMKALSPHIIFTAFSGSVGDVYSIQKAAMGIAAMTIGINVWTEATDHWANTDGKCNGEIILDTWAEGLQYTAKTTPFFDAFVARTGAYPVYTAATYDAIYQLKAAIEATDSLDADDIIPYLETHSYTGTAGTTAYYPMPAINLGGGVYALSEEQVRALYDLDSYNGTYVQSQWRVASSGAPHIAHDLVYGPGYLTGIGSQWQDGHKVGIWPMDLGDEYDQALTDQYGCWNFEYPGTVDVVIPIEGFLASCFEYGNRSKCYN